MTTFWQAFLCGVLDASKIHYPVIFLLRSSRLRIKTLKCVVLNGVLYTGSVSLVKFVVSPLIGLILPYIVRDEKTVNILYMMSTSLYTMCWLAPVYAFSLLFNTLWYQDIANHSFQLYGLRDRHVPFTR